MIRTDYTNQWILSRLAETHESHHMHPYEDWTHWQAVCGGCLGMVSIQQDGSKKVFEHLNLTCVAPQMSRRVLYR